MDMVVNWFGYFELYNLSPVTCLKQWQRFQYIIACENLSIFTNQKTGYEVLGKIEVEI